jgi:hypothetical protein
MKDMDLALMAGVVQASSAARMFGANIKPKEDAKPSPEKDKRAKAKAARKSNRRRMKSAK